MESVISVVLILVAIALIFGLGCQVVMTKKVFGYKQLRLLPKTEQSRFILMNLIFAPYWVLKGTHYAPRPPAKRKRSRTPTRSKGG